MKKSLIITIIVAAVVVIGIAAFFVWAILTDDMRPPDRPIESKPGKITVTSNGCCMHVENLEVIALTDAGDEQVIAQVQKVFQNNIFSFDMPTLDSSYTKIAVSCTFFYGDSSDFYEVVFSRDELVQSGLLLYIQEADGAYLNARTGNRQVSYKLNHATGGWDKLDTPMKLYK